MQRFYKPNLEKKFFIDDREFKNQVLKVLRWKINDDFIFFDWKNDKDFVYKLYDIQKDKLFFEKISEIEKKSEINFELNLFASLPNKIEKIEFIAQKATEIWVTNIYFWKSERSQKIFLNENKIERIKKIILEAVEQSGRNKIPEFKIFEKIDLEKIDWKNIFLHTKNENSKNLKDINFAEKINIFTWPEWWFSDQEVKFFEEKNWERIYLWDRILRTETAGIVTSFFIIQNF